MEKKLEYERIFAIRKIDKGEPMAGYIVYWPKEQIAKLKKAKDTGPIRVVLGSIHTKMPSIAKIKAGDVIYPVTLEKGTLSIMARLPVEKVESAFDYLLRETGERWAALIPKDAACEEIPYRNGAPIFRVANGNCFDHFDELPPEINKIAYLAERTPVPHLCHQEPFNCCSETAASGSNGSSIQPRPIPREMIPTLLFGPSKSKQKPLKLNAKGELTTMSLSGFARKISEETKKVFDSLFEDTISN